MPDRIHFIAYRDTPRGMEPVRNSPRIRTFPTREAAKEAAGPLGVAAAVTAERLRELEAKETWAATATTIVAGRSSAV